MRNTPQRDLVFAMTTSAENGGGIAAVNRMLIPALVEIAEERDLRIAIFSLQGTDADRPKELPARHVYRSFASRRSLFAIELFRRSRAQPIFLFERVGLARALVPLAIIRAARTVIFAHGSENWRSVQWMESCAIRTSELMVTNSRFTLRKMRQRFPGLRVEACPLGLSTSFALHAEPPPPASGLVYEACDGQLHELGDQVLLLVGRLHPAERDKGHDILISVLPRVLVRHPNVQLVFVGPDSDRSHIVGLAHEARVASSVFVPGFVETPALERLYEQCYAFVMPSRQEGFGLVYLEAMNCAKACVGCFGDGAEDIIVDGETGYLLHNPQNLDELLAVLLKLLDDPERTKSLGRNGFDRLHEHFTADQFRHRFKRILGQVLESPKPASIAPDDLPNAPGGSSRGLGETQEVRESSVEVGPER